MRRYWIPYQDHLNIFFNKKFISQKEELAKLTSSVKKYRAMINRIKNSKNTYKNDEGLIKEYAKKEKGFSERKSVVKGKQERLVKYSFSSVEINELTRCMSKSIMSEVIKGYEYKFPLYMGSLYLQFVESSKIGLTLDWVKSTENHKRFTKKFAPVLYDKYFIQKSITRKEYFKKSKPLLKGKEWRENRKNKDWLYLRWKPNYGFMRSAKHNYRFKFTAYVTEFDENPVWKTSDILERLNTPDKILNSNNLGNVNKSILIQIQNPKYIYNFIKHDI